MLYYGVTTYKTSGMYCPYLSVKHGMSSVAGPYMYACNHGIHTAPHPTPQGTNKHKYGRYVQLNI